MNVLITGSNTGMGFETALALARAGHTVLVTSRTQADAETACRAIAQETPNARLLALQLDLASFASVDAFASQVSALVDTLDTAIFNAGIMTPPYRLTEDGFESQFQVNYLGHFYLFQRLFPTIARGAQKKIINISSLSSEKGACRSVADFAAIARVDEANYQAMTSYRESKLAQVLFTVALADRYGEQGFKSYAVHPGVVNTNLFYRRGPALYKRLMQPLAKLGYLTGRLKTPAQGAETAIYLAENDIEPSGEYWADKAVRAMNPIARDIALANDLWAWSEGAVRG